MLLLVDNQEEMIRCFIPFPKAFTTSLCVVLAVRHMSTPTHHSKTSQTMVNHAKSELEKNIERRREHDALMVKAVEMYKAEQKKPVKERLGLCIVCENVSRRYFDDTGKIIKLSHQTLSRLATGGTTRHQIAAERSWLLPSEVNPVIEVVNELASRGFPFSHWRLKEVVDTILFARLGKDFPATGVGVQWTYCFAKQYSDRIKLYRSRPREDKRG